MRLFRSVLVLALMPATLLASALYVEVGEKSYLNKIYRNLYTNYKYLRVLPRYEGVNASAYLDYYYYYNSAKNEGAKKLEVGAQRKFNSWFTTDLALGKSSNYKYAPSLNLLIQGKSSIATTKTSPYLAYIYESYKAQTVSRYHYYRMGAEQFFNNTYSLDAKVELIKNEQKRGFGVALDNFVNLSDKWRVTVGGLRTCLANEYTCSGVTVDQYLELSAGVNYMVLPTVALSSQIFQIEQVAKTATSRLEIKSRMFKLGVTYFF